jgi:hypothetical protein
LRRLPALDLLTEFRLGGRLTLHGLLAGKLLFLNLTEMHAELGQFLAKLAKLLGNSRLISGERLDGGAGGCLIRFHLALLFGERILFRLQTLHLGRQRCEFAIHHGLFSPQGILSIRVLGGGAVQLHLCGV